MTGQIIIAGGGDEHNSPKIGGLFFKDIKKVLYIPLAWPDNDFQSCLSWFNGVTKNFGKIEIRMLTNPKEDIDFNNFDGIFIGGGNTFKLLKDLKDNKLDNKLIKFYKNGGKIFGGSAGAIIFGKDINISLICIDKDVNLVKLKDTSGMNLLKNHDLQAHFEDNQLKDHQNYIKESKRDIIGIPEGSALIIENDTFKVVGENPISLITQNSLTKYKPGNNIKL